MPWLRFPSSRPGAGATNHSVGYLWRKAKAAGVEYRLHDLQHFYASGLIAAGCDVVTVQRAMGHKSATVTLNTYSHRWPKAEDRTGKAGAGMFARAQCGTADRLRTDNG